MSDVARRTAPPIASCAGPVGLGQARRPALHRRRPPGAGGASPTAPIARRPGYPLAVGNSTAVRNRSATVTVTTPRGPVEVIRQEMRGLRQHSSWTTFWLARRKGRNDWAEADTARDAIRRATLLPPRKPPPWLARAAAHAERLIDEQALPDHDAIERSSSESSSDSARS
jgi:hypothetical protein